VVVVGACVVVVVLVIVVVVGAEPVTVTLHPLTVTGRIGTELVSNRLSTMSSIDAVVLAVASALKVIFAALTTPLGESRLADWKAAMLVIPGVGVFVVGLAENSAVFPPLTEAIVRTA